MILRLWSLYGRSKLVLGTLLMLYAVELVSFFINYVITDNQFPRNPLGMLIYLYAMHNSMSHDGFLDRVATAAPVIGSLTSCASARVLLVFADFQTSAQLALGAWMCLLVVIQFIKESVRMYRVGKQFLFSEYQKLLVWEGVVYFTWYVPH